MREEGIVIKADGKLCQVSVRRKSACGENCASCKAACSSREHICTAKNLVGAEKGDRVILETDSKEVLKSAFLVYILPILAFLTVFLVVSIRFSQGISALTAVLAAALHFLVMHGYDKKHKDDLLPEIKEIKK